MKEKIGIIGAGHVGAELANELMRGNTGDCVLVDIRESIAVGKAIDLTHSSPLRRSSVTIAGTNTFSALRNCGVVVMAVGMARKPGMSRDDLLEVNLNVISEVAEQCMQYASGAVWIVVTNPLDAMTYAAWKLSGKSPGTVIGMAGALDAARFRSLIAQAGDISAEEVHAMVLGSHGDLMVPLARYATIAGIPAVDLLGEATMQGILRETTDAGSRLVALLQSGSAYYAAASAIASMVDAIVHDKRKVICSSVLCSGEYGLNGVFIGVPVVLGASGVERIIELRLDELEREALNKAAGHLLAMQCSVDSRLDGSR